MARKGENIYRRKDGRWEARLLIGKKENGKRYTIITPDDDFEKIFGRRADKRRKTYNGTLKCQIYIYK